MMAFVETTARYRQGARILFSPLTEFETSGVA